MSFAKTNRILEELKDLARSMAMPTASYITPSPQYDADVTGSIGSLASSVRETLEEENNDPHPHSTTRSSRPTQEASSRSQPAKPAAAAADLSEYMRKDEQRPPTRRHQDPTTTKSPAQLHDVDLEGGNETPREEAAAADEAAMYDREVFDFDGSIFDGVKTTVVFYNSEPKRFEQVVNSMWLPEDVQEAQQPTEETPSSSEEEDENDDDECERADGRRRGTSSKTVRVRLPLFQFGGGVTTEQETVLQQAFDRAVRRARSGGNRRSNPPSPNHQQQPTSPDSSSTGVSPARSAVPLYVSVEQFQDRSFPAHVSTKEEFTSTAHSSPVDFIVEVEPSVVFDAAAAKATRRLELYRSYQETVAKRAMAETIQLRVIMDPLKTGFEEDKEFVIERGKVVASRFEIVDLLGKATFSRAVRAYDLHRPIHDDSGTLVGYAEVCLKIINNTKEFFDQSLDEIRLLELINSKQDPDESHVIRLIDYFYFKEHMFIVTELLSDNLYDYGKFNREQEAEFYFTLPRLRSIARQITKALVYIHSLGLMHCDLKPENILFVSHRRCIVKVIDFGSSCFLSDHLSGYIQSRSYRAPEVIVGADYDGRIDVWSLGAILVEMLTGEVLFSSETVPEMLARIVSVCGQPFPRGLLWEGRHTSKFFNKFGCLYEVGNREHDANAEDCYYLYTPMSVLVDEQGNSLTPEQQKFSVLRAKLAGHGVTDPDFIDFIEQCFTLDHKLRPTSAELLQHPFLRDDDEAEESAVPAAVEAAQGEEDSAVEQDEY